MNTQSMCYRQETSKCCLPAGPGQSWEQTRRALTVGQRDPVATPPAAALGQDSCFEFSGEEGQGHETHPPNCQSSALTGLHSRPQHRASALAGLLSRPQRQALPSQASGAGHSSSPRPSQASTAGLSARPQPSQASCLGLAPSGQPPCLPRAAAAPPAPRPSAPGPPPPPLPAPAGH